MHFKSPLSVLIMISALLKWTSAGDTLNFCVWTKIMSNGEAHHSFLRHDETQVLRLYHSVWTKEKSLVNCAWNDESAVTKNYLSLCKKREADFSEHPADESFDLHLMLESNSPCAAVTSTTTADRLEPRTGGRHPRSIEDHSPHGPQGPRGPHTTEDSSERETHRRVKRGFIVPGTLWCGSGNKAESYSDLGVFSQTDSCCREHDHCQETILSFQSSYGVFNRNIFTMSHCDCDNRFRECLQRSEDSISDVVGYTFFNVLKLYCFELTHTLQCVQRNWFGMCQLEEMALSAVVYAATVYNSTQTEWDDEDNMSTTSMEINITSQIKLSTDPQKSSTSDPDTHTSTPGSSTSRPDTHTSAPGSSASSTSRPDTHTSAPGSPTSTTSDPDTHTSAPGSPASSTSRPDTHTSAPGSPTSTISDPDTHTSAPGSPASSTSRPDTHTSAPGSPTSSTSRPDTHTSAPGSPTSSTSRPDTHTSAPGSPTTTTSDPVTHTSAPGSPASTTSDPDTHTSAPGSPAISVASLTPGTDTSNPDRSTLGRETGSMPVDSQEKENTQITQDPSGTTKPTTFTNPPLPGQNPTHTDGQQSCEPYRHLDECRLKIPPQQERYGLHNAGSRSLYHCNCTSRLFQALAQHNDLTGLQSVLLEYLSKSCFTLQHCTTESSCTAVLVQLLLPHLQWQQAGRDMEEWRHLQVLRLKVGRPNVRRAQRKGRSARLYKLCLRGTRSRRLRLHGAHSGLP